MKTVVYFIIILGFASFLSSCENSKVEAKKIPEKTPGDYKLFKISEGRLSASVKLPGTLEPFEFVKIYPKVNGFIKDINVDRGSEVKKNQVLMTLDAPEIEQHMSAAKLKYVESVSMLTTSKDKYKRLLETSKTPGTVSAYDLEAAYSKMMADSAVVQGELADYQAQKTMYSYLTVTAPFDGIITERNVHPGALVGPGTDGNSKPMLVLEQQNMLRLIANIPEQYSAQVKDGEEVHFRINALPGKDFTGTISRSSGSLSERFRSETIEIDVHNPDFDIKGGMYAEVTIPVSGNANAYLIPQSALVTTDEQKYVLAVVDNKTKKISVTEGNQNNDQIEVFGDLKPGDLIISNANYNIQDGVPIK